MSGVALLPETFSITIAAGLVGFVIASTGRYREALTAGWAIATASLGTLYLLDVHTATYEWVLINFFVGMGTGSLFTSLNLAVQSNIAAHEVSHALGFFAFFRALGQAIGVAVGGATFDNIFRSKVKQNPEVAAYTNQLSKGAAALIEILKTIPDSDPRKPALIQTYADSLKLLWPVMCGCAGIALVVSLFIKAYSLGPGEFILQQSSLNHHWLTSNRERRYRVWE
jgi:MFS family permease